MKDLSYENYLANPAVREHLERGVRRARAQAMYQCLVVPIARIFRRVFMRVQRKPASSLQMSV